MIEGSPSQTALMVAAFRAHHFLNATEPKILRDQTALALTGLGGAEEITAYMEKLTAGFAALSNQDIASLFVRNMVDSVCMRSRLVEERILSALERGLQQVVILGAGLDSTAYRCTQELTQIQVFEVDHPSTQAWKRQCLEVNGIEIPRNLQFVGFDFEQQTLDQALVAGGVSRDRITLFSWLGVIMYLSDEAVRSGLTHLGSYAPGSELIVDFVMPDNGDDNEVVPNSIENLSRMVSQMGEPFKSQHSAEDLDQLLAQAGFQNRHYYKSGELVALYLDNNKAASSLPEETGSLFSAVV